MSASNPTLQTTETTETPEVSIEDQFKEICEELSGMSTNAKTLQTHVKELHRTYNRLVNQRRLRSILLCTTL